MDLVNETHQRWEFHMRQGRRWCWRLIGSNGAAITIDSPDFRSYLTCLQDARRHGYSG